MYSIDPPSFFNREKWKSWDCFALKGETTEFPRADLALEEPFCSFLVNLQVDQPCARLSYVIKGMCFFAYLWTAKTLFKDLSLVNLRYWLLHIDCNRSIWLCKSKTLGFRTWNQVTLLVKIQISTYTTVYLYQINRVLLTDYTLEVDDQFNKCSKT